MAWDDVYGGVLRAMHVHGAYTVDKVLWAQEEVLIGTMFLIEHTDWNWPRCWFARMFEYVQGKFPLKPHGFPLYILESDRQVTFQPHVARKGNYHRPRHLMLNLMALDRILNRDGTVSDFWET